MADNERATRMLAEIEAILADREAYFRKNGIDTMSDYRRMRAAGEAAHGAAAEAGLATAVPSPGDERGAAPADGAPSPAVTVGRWNVGLRVGSREALLSRTQGGIVSWTKSGRGCGRVGGSRGGGARGRLRADGGRLRR